jgi:hypothetical protein
MPLSIHNSFAVQQLLIWHCICTCDYLWGRNNPQYKASLVKNVYVLHMDTVHRRVSSPCWNHASVIIGSSHFAHCEWNLRFHLVQSSGSVLIKQATHFFPTCGSGGSVACFSGKTFLICCTLIIWGGNLRWSKSRIHWSRDFSSCIAMVCECGNIQEGWYQSLVLSLLET